MSSARLALIVATVSWGLSTAVSDLVLTSFTASDLFLVEAVSGAIGVLIIELIARRRRAVPARIPWRSATILGLLEPGVVYLLMNLGLALTSAVAGNLLLALESVFFVILAAVVLHERARRIEIVAVGIGVIGAAIVGLSASGGESSLLGNTFVIGSAFFAAVYSVAARRLANGLAPTALVARQGVVSAAFALVVWLIARAGGQPTHLDVSWALVLGVVVGLSGFTLPTTLYTYAITRVRPAAAAVAINLIPVSGVVFSILIGRGAPTTAQIIGGSIVLFGVALIARSELTHDQVAQAVTEKAATGSPEG